MQVILILIFKGGVGVKLINTTQPHCFRLRNTNRRG